MKHGKRRGFNDMEYGLYFPFSPHYLVEMSIFLVDNPITGFITYLSLVEKWGLKIFLTKIIKVIIRIYRHRNTLKYKKNYLLSFRYLNK